MINMFEIKDGSRTLQFEGVKLASSSSWKRGSERWIEFNLYRTTSGLYILSRVGVSRIFHTASCPLVRRYNLDERATSDLEVNSVPCAECRPTLNAPYVFPEKAREWAQVSESPDAVLDALYRYDDNDVRYLTRVAAQLLERASDRDSAIDQLYRVELIP
jgi:hypothetical protein